MSTIKKFRSIVILSFIFLSGMHAPNLEGGFQPPSSKLRQVVSDAEINQSLQLRKLSSIDKEMLERIAAEEKSGFLGYHGDSMEFYVYQDIIRYVLEVIVGIPVRTDFHFLAVPLDPAVEIQTKEKLAALFMENEKPALVLAESTFPLNFTIWDNHNRLGLNSIHHFLKNEPVKPLGYKRRLNWLFERLGIKESEIETLFNAAFKELRGNYGVIFNGVILQFFDESMIPYTFSKHVAYPSYPNGFISANRTVDEYFLDDEFIPPYPHEIRLMLTTHLTLNPISPLKVIRHVPPFSVNNQKAYEKAIKDAVKKLSFNKSKRNSYKKELLKAWEYDL